MAPLRSSISAGSDISASVMSKRWIGAGKLRYILMTPLMLETFHEALGVNVPSIGRSRRVMRDDRFDTKPLNSLASYLVRDFEERIIGNSDRSQNRRERHDTTSEGTHKHE
jgi:hypothetical protein